MATDLRDVHPPLFYLGIRAWLGLVGTNFVAAKWLTIACGVLAIPVIYQLGRRLFGPQAGLCAAILLTVSPAHIFLSATVRDFAPGLLLSTLSLLVLLRLLAVPKEGRRRARGENRRRRWAAVRARPA
ncbi:MAG: glycosyltransferase family 39 protein [Dehalococcoidales bacterium]|nr:glycosyltransferase family 39 protein [Dehalococcoidales bacterium]